MKEDYFRTHILPLKDQLYRLALRITHNVQEAEDVVQDTLLKLWDKRTEWSTIENLDAYTLTICRHLAIDRSNTLSSRSSSLDVLSSSPATAAPSPLDETSNHQRMALLQQFFDNLSEPQRTIFHLREIEEKSYREIADILSLSEEQVKTHLFRARQRIRQKFLEIEKQ